MLTWGLRAGPRVLGTRGISPLPGGDAEKLRQGPGQSSVPSHETWSKAPAPRGSRLWVPRLLGAELWHLEAKAAEAPA